MSKKPVCPNCQDKSDIDENLKCSTCGSNLEYASEDGTMRVVETQRKCPRCNSSNNSEVKYCESCGAQVGNYCQFCKKYHFIEDKVCPRTGEPMKPMTQEPDTSSILSKIAVAVSIAMIFLFGTLMYMNKGTRVTPPKGSNGVIAISSPGQGPQQGQPQIDVVFVVDATGSMGDEIEAVKTKIHDMVRTIAAGQPRPYVRYGIVAYRDRGDTYVAKKYDLTDNTQTVTANINELHADGGGDTPESVGEALEVALNQMNWDKSANTKKMVFLIGDAAPQTGQDRPDFRNLANLAKERKIPIFTIGCSGITSSGESEFREIANLSGGQFDYLTYQQAYRRQDGTTVDVLSAGEKKYVVDASADKDEWKGGYRTMMESKKAKVAADEELREMAPAPSVAGGKNELKNNLDQVLVQQVQMEAEKMGVKYKK